MQVARTDDEIDDQLNKAAEAEDAGSAYPGASFEQGVAEGLRWVLGLSGDLPLP